MRLEDIILKLVRPLQRRVNNMIARAVIRAVNDSKQFQTVTIDMLADESSSNLQHLQNYGMTAHPPDNSEGLALFIAGNRDHGVVLNVENRQFRVKSLAKGEVCIYTDEGDKIHFKRGRKIEVTTLELKVTATTKVEVITGALTATVTGAATVTAATATVTSPTVTVVAATGVTMTTPLLTVTGLISCAGIGAGVAPVAGKAKVSGDLEAAGNVKDSVGTMAAMRATYNGHTHPETGTTTGATTSPM